MLKCKYDFEKMKYWIINYTCSRVKLCTYLIQLEMKDNFLSNVFNNTKLFCILIVSIRQNTRANYVEDFRTLSQALNSAIILLIL